MTSRFRVARYWLYFLVVLCLVFNILLVFHVNDKVENPHWQHNKWDANGSTSSVKGIFIWDTKTGITNKKKAEQHHGRHHQAPRDGPCLRQECILEEAKSLARAFPLKSNFLVSTPTNIQNNNDNIRDELSSQKMTTITATGSYKHYGLLYVKVPKTASSTAARAALRIGKKYKIPVAAQEHSWPLEQEYQNRHPTQSFLFASIRDPTDRAISFLSYTASRTRALNFTHSSTNSKEEAAQNQREELYLLRHLREMDRSGNVVRSEGRSGAQLYFTSLRSIPKDSAWRPSHPAYVSNALRVRDNVRRVLESYDFFLVTDRMEESLVAMALLMGISTMEDILAFSSKRSSSNQYLPVQDTNNDKQNTKNHNMVCVPLRRLTIDDGKPNVQAYLTSAEWYAMNYGDFLLHAAVSESLNRTIDEVLGRDRFENALADYRRLLDGATRACIQDEDNQHPHVHWPCSSQGVLQLKEAIQDCYHGDSGCGYRCIDNWLAASGVKSKREKEFASTSVS